MIWIRFQGWIQVNDRNFDVISKYFLLKSIDFGLFLIKKIDQSQLKDWKSGLKDQNYLLKDWNYWLKDWNYQLKDQKCQKISK